MDYMSDESDDVPLPIIIWKRSLETKNGILSTFQETIASSNHKGQDSKSRTGHKEKKFVRKFKVKQRKNGESSDELSDNEEKENEKRKIFTRRQKKVRNERNWKDESKTRTVPVVKINNSTQKTVKKESGYGDMEIEEKLVAPDTKYIKLEYKSGSDTEIEVLGATTKNNGLKTKDDLMTPYTKTTVKAELNSGSDTEIEDVGATEKRKDDSIKTEQNSDSDTEIDDLMIIPKPKFVSENKLDSGSDVGRNENNSVEESNKNNKIEESVNTKKNEDNSGSDTEIEDNFATEKIKHEVKGEFDSGSETDMDENIRDAGTRENQNSGSDTEIKDGSTSEKEKPHLEVEDISGSDTDIDKEILSKTKFEKGGQTSGSDIEIEEELSNKVNFDKKKTENNSGSGLEREFLGKKIDESTFDQKTNVENEKNIEMELTENVETEPKVQKTSVSKVKSSKTKAKSFTSLNDIFFDDVVKKKPPPRKKVVK